MYLLEARFGVAPTPDPILEAELAKLPTSEEMRERIKSIKEIVTSVWGNVIASPSAARDQEAVVEDTYSRTADEIARRRGPVRPRERDSQTGNAAKTDRGTRKKEGKVRLSSDERDELKQMSLEEKGSDPSGTDRE
jgi:hypothetical protein